MSEIEVGKRTGRCSATGRVFEEGERYCAALIETPEGVDRRDYALDAWQGPPEGTLCFWHGRVPVRAQKGPVTVNADLLTRLFCRLEEETSPGRQQFRFMLALLLMRKRILRLSDTIQDGDEEYWELTLMSDRSTHRVLNPRLSPEATERLSEQLTAVLSGEIDAMEWLEDDLSDADDESGREEPLAGGESLATAGTPADDQAHAEPTEHTDAPS